jgi:hypothetical protein
MDDDAGACVRKEDGVDSGGYRGTGMVVSGDVSEKGAGVSDAPDASGVGARDQGEGGEGGADGVGGVSGACLVGVGGEGGISGAGSAGGANGNGEGGDGGSARSAVGDGEGGFATSAEGGGGDGSGAGIDKSPGVSTDLDTSVSSSRVAKGTDVEMEDLFEEYKKRAYTDEGVDVNGYVSMDDEKACEAQLTVRDCVDIAKEYIRRYYNHRRHKKKEKEIQDEKMQKEEVKDELDQKDDLEVRRGMEAVKEAYTKMEEIRKVFKSAANVSAEQMKALGTMEKAMQGLLSANKVQTNIPMFFTKKEGNDCNEGVVNGSSEGVSLKVSGNVSPSADRSARGSVGELVEALRRADEGRSIKKIVEEEEEEEEDESDDGGESREEYESGDTDDFDDEDAGDDGFYDMYNLEGIRLSSGKKGRNGGVSMSANASDDEDSFGGQEEEVDGDGDGDEEDNSDDEDEDDCSPRKRGRND